MRFVAAPALADPSRGFFVSGEPDVVSANIIIGNGWENQWQAIFMRELDLYQASKGLEKNQVTFVDIGSNLGWHSFRMAQAGYRVISFEPLQKNEMIHRSNMCLLDPDGNKSNWILINRGLGSSKATCRVFSGDLNSNDGVITCNDSVPTPVNHTEILDGKILVERLDDILPASELEKLNIGLTKIDVETYERFVIEGGPNYFKSLERLVIEFNPGLDNQNLNWVFDKLVEYGFTMSTPNGLVLSAFPGGFHDLIGRKNV